MNEGQHAGDAAATRWTDHQLRPAMDLLARIPLTMPKTVVDLGCGDGKVTRVLARHWLSARIYGLGSKKMLDTEQAVSSNITWDEADPATWQSDVPVDIVYSNSALHRYDEHARLFPRLASSVRKGGCLAVQMPRRWNRKSHNLMLEVLEDHDGKGSSLGTAALRQAVARRWANHADQYYDYLSGSVTSMDIWETEYLENSYDQNLLSAWVHGTDLRPILEGLDEQQAQTFMDEYRRRVRRSYPRRADGRTLYRVRRLFIVALV